MVKVAEFKNADAGMSAAVYQTGAKAFSVVLRDDDANETVSVIKYADEATPDRAVAKAREVLVA
jgi:hypothetical protein